MHARGISGFPYYLGIDSLADTFTDNGSNTKGVAIFTIPLQQVPGG